MWIAIIACAAAATLAAALALVTESMRRRPQGRLDTVVAMALWVARGEKIGRSSDVQKLRRDMEKTARQFQGRLPPVASTRDVAVPAGDHDAFIRGIEAQLREDSPERRRLRRESVRHETWEYSAGRVLALLDSLKNGDR